MSFLPDSVLNIPGERFEIPLDDSDDEAAPPAASAPFSFVGDIVEKPTSTAVPQPPARPPTNATASGFPSQKKRVPKGPSRFKQRAAAQPAQRPQPTPPKAPARSERDAISAENEARISTMSAEEIEEERRELMEKLDPKLIEMLLKRGAPKEEGEGSGPAPKDPPRPRAQETDRSIDSYLKRATIEEPKEPLYQPPKPVTSKPAPVSEPRKDDFDVDAAAPPIYDPALFPPAESYHFPVPPSADHDLDPSSPDFLAQLHSKYYPTLPADPSKLLWMAPVSEAEAVQAGYHPSLDSVAPAALRFDFRGNLIPPRKALDMPAHLGLHHHAEAPGAAGYTVPELARLARSNFPGQRCVAIQTLGRVLYRLGTGRYLVEDITQGLWRCMKEGGVIETLEEAAGEKTGHLSVKAYAQEALWLWQKGGGQKWQAQ